ncbi:uncharacterized protein TNIN_287711 [Trichonephila inaurata madagascariensis]|uniref:Phospholipase A2-like domain-containing protein n=1 Tax=Trichonephila inaurata madagascariensis TaxID=2747483 RepID=A0A8X6Y7W1_9ARAC|nr:uncharacterized protein TNIN_287711 [Trichonephila inaurata madagascariensis]
MIPIEDYTEVEEFVDSNQHYLLPKHSFRLLIAGASGTGKTNLLLNFIYDYLEFDNLFVCAKDMFEPKYAKLKEKYTMFHSVDINEMLIKYPKKKRKIMLELYETFGKKGTLFSSDTKEFITVDDLDPSCKNVVVFDDCMTDKNQKSIEDFFIRGPGTQLLKGKTRLNPDLTYKEWSKPINRVDKAAYEHDVCYLKNKDTKTRNEVCDSNMMQEVDDIPNPTIRERLDRAVVKPIIKAKKTFRMECIVLNVKYTPTLKMLIMPPLKTVDP